ncbi:hypothetical protein HPB48_004378 [Haemaphysalis longicornis]|uniref:Ig-like domain-containing protein n=1 Tax=Haemaphysalis longicornis TaxID=44386 RepID=A0A9J6G1L7_HAELO|nr:hypothetical protein HPB48_004378 [Haemaphysalis longicornis]
MDVERSRKSLRLSIQRLSRSERGLQNAILNYSSRSSLIFLPRSGGRKPAPVEARIAPEVLTAHVGQPASLRCLAAGRPAPQVRWYKDTLEVLEDGSRVRLLDDRRLLELSSVGPQDGGMYQCLASNTVSQAQASAQVILGGASRETG